LTFELADVNLPKKSWVKVSQIRTLPVERIGKKLGWIYPLDYILSVDQLRIRSRKMWYPVGAKLPEVSRLMNCIRVLDFYRK